MGCYIFACDVFLGYNKYEIRVYWLCCELSSLSNRVNEAPDGGLAAEGWLGGIQDQHTGPMCEKELSGSCKKAADIGITRVPIPNLT